MQNSYAESCVDPHAERYAETYADPRKNPWPNPNEAKGHPSLAYI